MTAMSSEMTARSLLVKITCGAEAAERTNQAWTVAAMGVAAGASVSVWLTGEALDAELERSDPQSDKASSHPPLNPGLLNGPDGPQMGANVGRNSAEGRILPALGAYERI